MNTSLNSLHCCMEQPGAWYQYPAAMLSRGRIVGWGGDEHETRLIVNIYELRGDPIAQVRQLLSRLGPHREARITHHHHRFEMEAAGALLIPGHAYALKWNGTVIAWLADHSFASSLVSVLNAFIHAYSRTQTRPHRGGLTRISKPTTPSPELNHVA